MQSEGEDSNYTSPVGGHMEADIVRFPGVRRVDKNNISASEF